MNTYLPTPALPFHVSNSSLLTGPLRCKRRRKRRRAVSTKARDLVSRLADHHSAVPLHIRHLHIFHLLRDAPEAVHRRRASNDTLLTDLPDGHLPCQYLRSFIHVAIGHALHVQEYFIGRGWQLYPSVPERHPRGAIRMLAL